MAGEYHL